MNKYIKRNSKDVYLNSIVGQVLNLHTITQKLNIIILISVHKNQGNGN